VADFRLHRELLVPQPIAVAFDFFSRPENLQTITPPWLRFGIVTPQSEMRAGTLIGYRLRVHGIPFRWLTKIDRWTPPFEFVDIQLKGPYKFWRHVHLFSQVDRATRISDTVDYSLLSEPWVGKFIVGRLLVICRNLRLSGTTSAFTFERVTLLIKSHRGTNQK
jgi:ligand-binding SRPBCC domain-containing protein